MDLDIISFRKFTEYSSSSTVDFIRKGTPFARLLVPNEGYAVIENVTQLMGLNLEWFDYTLFAPGMESIGGPYVAPQEKVKKDVIKFFGKSDPLLELLWAPQPPNEHWQKRYVAHVENDLLVVAQATDRPELLSIFLYKAVPNTQRVTVSPEFLDERFRGHWFRATWYEPFQDEPLDSCIQRYYREYGYRQRLDLGDGYASFQDNAPYSIDGFPLKGMAILPDRAGEIIIKRQTLLRNIPDANLVALVKKHMGLLREKRSFYHENTAGLTGLADKGYVEPLVWKDQFKDLPVLPLHEWPTIVQ
ncbi:hypothetical protein HYY73_04955 [Candidatus Woesearchaeota archaeon]|nr:hypothetical protein [Candidatus Woesearchaeota archaeon]